MERIGIVGLGRMGSALAERMVSQGASVTTWTRSGKTLEGIRSETDLEALARASDIIITSLYDDAAVAEVLDTLSGVGDLQGKLVIETSTVSPTCLTDHQEAFIGFGAALIDAPIAGGPDLIAIGSCSVLLGGSKDDVARAAGVLSLVSDRIAHVGPLGAGQVMKAVNNGLAQIYFAGLSELLPLAKRAGISLETVMGVLAKSPVGMPMVIDRIPKILGHDQTAGFVLTGVSKDNGVFRRILEDYGLPSALLDLAGKSIDESIAGGLGDKDPAIMLGKAFRDG